MSDDDWDDDERLVDEAEGGALVVHEPSTSERIVAVSAELAELTAEAHRLAEEDDGEEPTTGTALIVGGGDAAAIDAKRRLLAMRVRASEARELMEAKREELEKLMRAQLDEARRAMGELSAQVQRAQEAIWTISLYLGNEETIHRLRDGEPAPADTPITVRQLVLHMDEECAVAAESGGIDAVSIGKFDQWLLEDPAHLDQVLPEEKGIVALRPRRRDKNRERQSEEALKADRMAYLLIRNGERLFRLFIDPELDLGRRLIPSPDEFRLASEDRWGDPIKPDTRAWEQAWAAADRRRRHYMRIALILEGLVHRTTVLQPLPPQGVSFLDDESHRAGRVAFLRDLDMTLTDGGEDFKTWHQRVMAELEPGMRIVGAFNLGYDEGLDRFRYRSDDFRRGNERLNPNNAGFPESGVPYVTEATDHGDLLIRYWEREPRYIGDSWGMGGELRLPKVRSSCRIKRTDDFVLPFDLVDPADLERFMADRVSRQEYLRLFPLFRSIMEAKRREAEAEEPFRRLLVGRMMAENGVSEQEALAELDDLVWWFKSKVKQHRPLLLEASVPEFDLAAAEAEAEREYGSRSRRRSAAVQQARELHERKVRELRDAPEHARKALSMIVAEHARRLKDRRRPINQAIVASLRERYPAALAVVRPRNAGYRVVLPEGDGPYVAWEDFTAKGEPTGETAGWQMVGKQWMRWTFAWSSDRWASWPMEADPAEHLTGPERERLLERLDSHLKAHGKPVLAKGWWKGEACAWTLERGWHVRDRVDPDTTDPRLVEGPVLGYHEVQWRRLPSGELRMKVREGTASRPWSGFGKSDTRWPWERELHERPGVTVYGQVLAEYNDQRELAHQEREDRGARERRIERAVKGLERQWLEARERERYEAFLAEYGDPGLWDGHRKMLDELKVPGGVPHELFRIIAPVVVAGRSPEGFTLEAVHAMALETGKDVPAVPRGWGGLLIPVAGALATR